MPSFKLCYKSYDYEITLNAARQFNRETGKCLLDFLCLSWSAYLDASRMNGMLKDRTISMMSQVPTDDAAFALYCLAKEKNSALTYDEVWDAAMKTNFVEQGDGKNEPPQIVLASIGSDFITERMSLNEESKKDSSQPLEG